MIHKTVDALGEIFFDVITGDDEANLDPFVVLIHVTIISFYLDVSAGNGGDCVDAFKYKESVDVVILVYD